MGTLNKFFFASSMPFSIAAATSFDFPSPCPTIPHMQEGKYRGAKVLIRPAATGTGVIAGGAMRAVLESVGVTDVLAKSKGSSNPHNVVKATMDALVQLRDANAISKIRGISLEKVYNG